MLPDVQLLTIATTFANYKPNYSSSTARLQEKATEFMAHQYHRSSRTQGENELWFSMPSSAWQQQEQSRIPEQSAYRATSNRVSMSPTSSRTPPMIPTISTTSDLNKPLPPSPSDSGKKKRKPPSLRGILRREPSSHLDSNHLRPEPYPQQYSSLNSDTNSQYHDNYTRSMPSSPYAYDHASRPPNSPTPPRTHSAAANYPDAVEYQPYSLPQQQLSAPPIRQQRSTSMHTYFETSPPRSRTFPEHTLSPTGREAGSSRPRPHTWLSPTEPFTDISQFHLFAEATTGLPNDSDPFSPTGPPRLQGSLFARRAGNDTIPLPFQHPSRVQTERPHQRNDWQNFEPPPSVSSRSVSRPTSSLPQPEPNQQWQPPPHMNAINVELEMLGIDDDQAPDDELPDYAQSQAEMHAQKRQEASARARELEARWRGTRGG